MSAIWGMVSWDTKSDTEKINKQMEKSLHQYKIDRFSSVVGDNLVFGYGAQYFTELSVNERLPIDNEDGVYLTADCVLDNREDVLRELSLGKDAPDGEIIFEAYRKWDEKLINHLVGIFAFAIYDRKKKKFLLYTDHTSSRCVNYTYKDGKIYFATTYRSILDALDEKDRNLDDRWMSECLSNPSADLIMRAGFTPYKNIFQLEAGTYIKVQDGKIEEKVYWNPKKEVKRLRLKSMEEYKENYIRVFKEIIKSHIKEEKDVGMMLSAGLDSTAVASITAPILKENGGTLHTYTSVPHPEYENEKDRFYIVDESKGAKIIGSKFDNVKQTFIDYEEKDAFTELEDYIKGTELPLKSSINLAWLSEIYKHAANDGCRILLKGQYGNSTISYGAILTYVYQKVMTGHFIKAYKQLRRFKQRKRVGKRKIVDVTKDQIKQKIVYDDSMFRDGYLKDHKFKKWDILNTVKMLDKVSGGSIMDSKAQWKSAVFSESILQHLGMFDTKISLMTGVLMRDPTKDKRMIELCLSYPIDCFIIDGEERALVRNFLRGIVPNELLDDKNRRGLQGADFRYRLERNKSINTDKIAECLKNPRLNVYMKKEKIKELCNRIEEGNTKFSEQEWIWILVICGCSYFLDAYN